MALNSFKQFGEMRQNIWGGRTGLKLKSFDQVGRQIAAKMVYLDRHQAGGIGNQRHSSLSRIFRWRRRAKTARLAIYTVSSTAERIVFQYPSRLIMPDYENVL